MAAVVVAGSVLGVIENYAGFIFGAEFQTAFLFSLLVAILLLRSVLLGRRRKVLE